MQSVDSEIASLKRELFGITSESSNQTLTFTLGRLFLGTKDVPGNGLAKALSHLVEDKLGDGKDGAGVGRAQLGFSRSCHTPARPGMT